MSNTYKPADYVQVLERAKIALRKAIGSTLNARQSLGGYFRFHLDNGESCLVLMAAAAYRGELPTLASYVVVHCDYQEGETKSVFQDNYRDRAISVHASMDAAFETFWRAMNAQNPTDAIKAQHGK